LQKIYEKFLKFSPKQAKKRFASLKLQQNQTNEFKFKQILLQYPFKFKAK